MKLLFVLASFPLLLNTISFQAPPDTLWTKVFGNGWEGGGCYGGDVGTSVLETSDGGFAITGWIANSNGDSDLWILRTNEIGDTLWTKRFSGESGDDAGYSIQSIDGNGFIISGEKETFNASCRGGSKGWLLCLDENSDTLWTKTYVDTSCCISLHCVRQVDQGGFILCGLNGDGLVMRVNEFGDILWTKEFEGTGQAWSIEEATNGGWFIVTEHCWDVFLYKIDENGNLIWQRVVRGLNDPLSLSKSIQSTDDGGCIVAGMSYSDSADVFLVKVNQKSQIVWDRNYNLEGNQEPFCIRKLPDGGYIVAGYSEINENKDALIIRFNEQGDIIWTKTLGGEYDDFAYAVEQTSDGGYIVTGGTCPDSNQVPDLWLIRLAGDSVSGILNEETVTTFNVFQNFPNPFNPTTTIKYQIPELSFVTIKVFDVLGSEIATLVNEEKPIGSYEVEFNATSLPSGIYFYRIQAGRFVETKKMILLK